MLTPHPKSPRPPEIDIRLQIDRQTNTPLFKQVYYQIENMILTGVAKPGESLPSVRKLALQASVSVDTIIRAYRDLIEEGLIIANVGSGHIVTSATVNHLPPKPTLLPGSFTKTPTRNLNQSARLAVSSLDLFSTRVYANQPLATYTPTMAQFLERDFLRIASQLARSPWVHNFYNNPQGQISLRQGIAKLLRLYRGVMCSPDQIVITNGTVQSLNLISKVFFEANDEIWLEDPSLNVFSDTFEFNGLRPIYVPVDDEGFNPELALKMAPGSKGVFVTPPSQMPTSVPLSDERKIRLLQWAMNSGGWIIEDDTDAFIWLSGHPLAPIRAMTNASSCVIYMGSFSLQIFPGIKIAYIVAPENFCKALTGAKLLSDRSSSEVNQEVLADFINSENFTRYHRKVLKQYVARFNFINRILQLKLSNLVSISNTVAGPHIALTFLHDWPQKEISAELY